MKFLTPMFLVLALATTAHSNTCAEQLRHRRHLWITLATSSTIWAAADLATTMVMSSYNAIFLLKQARILEAATTITYKAPEAKLAQARARFNHFYFSLEKIHSNMEMGKKEVLALLHRLNLEGVQDGQCSRINTRNLTPISELFFPEANAESYLQLSARKKAAQDIIDAAVHARSIKNEQDPI